MSQAWDSEESVRRWDAFAPQYVEKFTDEGDLHREVLLNPALFELLGDVRGRRVLDDGCGEGYLSRLLARRGAMVTAIDYAESMLRIARERTPADLGVEFRHANAERLGFLPDAGFDVVVSNMVLIDLADYEAAIREAHRLLVPGGLYVLAISHPCFSTPAAGRWMRDEQGERLYWMVDRYFDEGPYEQRIMPRYDAVLLQFHRTLTSYVRASLRAGFILEDLVEPKPSPEMIEKHPEFVHDLRMSHFIVFKLRKPARVAS